MAVFRVERNTGYTVMSNHHLRNKELSLKAKGLLSQMLSLPEDWDYTLAGLSHINREKIDAIREAVKELEKAGYIVRSRERDEKGRLRGADYVIYEQPQPREPEAATSGGQPPILDLPTLENPTLDNPTLEKPTQEKPTLENPTQLNKDISSKEQSITDLSSTHSFPFHSLNPLPFEQGEAATPPERKRTEAKSNSAVEIYREIIKDNIEYDHLIQNCKIDADRLNEIVDLMLETVCTARKTIRIAGDDYPAELVKSKFLKLNSSHIEFVLDCMRENTTKVRNIKQYLKAVLFNAPSTIDSYYTALVNHDFYGSKFFMWIWKTSTFPMSPSTLWARNSYPCTLCICRRWGTAPICSRRPAMCQNTMKTRPPITKYPPRCLIPMKSLRGSLRKRINTSAFPMCGAAAPRKPLLIAAVLLAMC